jgi:hypothetical protein
MTAQAILPPIHSKDKLPLEIKTIKYPEITGGSASGRVVIKSKNTDDFLNLLTKRIMSRDIKKQMNVPVTEIFNVVKITSE